jgi:hypothetical protein
MSKWKKVLLGFPKRGMFTIGGKGTSCTLVTNKARFRFLMSKISKKGRFVKLWLILDFKKHHNTEIRNLKFLEDWNNGILVSSGEDKEVKVF